MSSIHNVTCIKAYDRVGPGLCLLCLLVCLAPVSCVEEMFRGVDPVSGAEVMCHQCPPGQFLRQRCTAAQQSVCEDCPPGSFTALWNHISRCLRCGVCGRNMEETRSCSRDRDCDCQCKHGYFYSQRAGMCVRWSECATGQGVTAPGETRTKPGLNQDIVCALCANGTFSDQVSSESTCSAHKTCSAHEKAIIKGNSWHDAVCATCQEARHKGKPATSALLTLSYPEDILRTILPSFFSHHTLSLRRLRHVVSKLPSVQGRVLRRRSLSGLNQDQLRSRLDLWIRESHPDYFRTLHKILQETGAAYTAEKLQHKLDRIKSALNHICPNGNGTELELNQV
uniref:TNFR-Cys domain-containing protein n=1 Tax=Periophthalmus magnuspinnatus TaxID=409849 RepID=A0A3B4A860_9GOBI